MRATTGCATEFDSPKAGQRMGLIVNLFHVLFDTEKHLLKPGAREKLAKVADILLAYRGSISKSAAIRVTSAIAK
jgi:outer membrane protein OmpA-like peptidoglycan-associated protein